MSASRLALCICMLASTQPAFAKSVFISIDTSKSNPVVTDEASAKLAARYVGGIVAGLQPGDVVHIRTFGDRSAAHAENSRSIQLRRKHPPEMAATQVAQYIAALPSKTLKGQSETQILAHLEFGQFECDQNSSLILLTDAIEDSPTIKAKSLLSGKKLPPPKKDVLKGCAVTMFGVGRSKDGSLSPVAVKRLEAAWSAWMKEAGADFKAVIDP